MTGRHTVNTITSDALDALYYRLDGIRDAAILHRQRLIRTSELYAAIEADPPHSTKEAAMTDQTPKRITIDAPSEATILAGRHLDQTEGRVQVGSTVDESTRSAITCVLDYIAKAHNAPTRDETSPGKSAIPAKPCGVTAGVVPHPPHKFMRGRGVYQCPGHEHTRPADWHAREAERETERAERAEAQLGHAFQRAEQAESDVKTLGQAGLGYQQRAWDAEAECERLRARLGSALACVRLLRIYADGLDHGHQDDIGPLVARRIRHILTGLDDQPEHESAKPSSPSQTATTGRDPFDFSDCDTPPAPAWTPPPPGDRLSPLARALVDDFDELDLAEMLVKAQDELAALRAAARSYCPACGRGDAAPTVEHWEQQKQRADQAEELLRIAHETSNRSEAERAHAAQRAEQLAGLLDEVLRSFVHKGHPGEPCLQTGWISERTVARWRETLYQPAPAPAAAPALWLLAGTRDLNIPTQHAFTARPVDPETERAATERAIQAAADSEKAAAWFAAHSQPAPAATEATDTQEQP